MNDRFRLFPEQASTVAPEVDQLYSFLLAVASFFTLLIFLLIVFFAIHYRRGNKVNRKFRHTRFWLLEVTWSVIPLAITMVMFTWGADLFVTLNTPPANCREVDVLGKQWMWRIQHPEGRHEIDTLHVPAGRPVRLRMISDDVIHSMYIPAFRVKQDVLPGRYTYLWFEATKPGQYDLYCAEYCGTSHARMRGRVVVMEPADFAVWLQGGTGRSNEPPEVTGERLFEQFRCHTCHTNQPNSRCPPLVGVYEKRVSLTNGETAIADDAYLRESILDPSAKIVAGYQPLMPSYQGQIGEDGVLQIIAYLKTLKPLHGQELEKSQP